MIHIDTKRRRSSDKDATKVPPVWPKWISPSSCDFFFVKRVFFGIFDPCNAHTQDPVPGDTQAIW